MDFENTSIHFSANSESGSFESSNISEIEKKIWCMISKNTSIGSKIVYSFIIHINKAKVSTKYSASIISQKPNL